jgi:hypothetical protein
VPLTPFQQRLLGVLARGAVDDRYLAGGAAIHLSPTSVRYSDALDFFHDAEARVASAFARDREVLGAAGYTPDVELVLPGFVRALVSRGGDATRVDWAHDSSWRFMPLVRDSAGGWLLHPVDLAINKLLALAGRDEPRDFVDTLYVHQQVLPLAGLVWAAAGKDPGLTPLSLLELLKRRGRPRPEAIARLQLAVPFDLAEARGVWRAAIDEAEHFCRARPPAELGCLYYHVPSGQFGMPRGDLPIAEQGFALHVGAPGGVVPRVTDAPLDAA